MKNWRERLNSKRGKIGVWLAVLLVVVLIILLVTGFLLKRQNQQLENEIVNSINPNEIINNIGVSDDDEEENPIQYERLSKDSFSINQEASTISLPEIDSGRIIFSDNPDGPDTEDQWYEVDSTSNSEETKEIVIEEDAIQKKYVYYMATSDYSFIDSPTTSRVLITSLADFKTFRDKVNAGTTFSGKTVVLMKDLDLSGISNWTPIGTEAKPFKGTFHGNGYVISNLKTNTNTNSGLFGYIQSATIKYVSLSEITVKGGKNIGGLVGNAKSSTILTCTVAGTSTIYGTGEHIGGIVGDSDSTTIEHCRNGTKVTISGPQKETSGNIGRYYRSWRKNDSTKLRK